MKLTDVEAAAANDLIAAIETTAVARELSVLQLLGVLRLVTNRIEQEIDDTFFNDEDPYQDAVDQHLACCTEDHRLKYADLIAKFADQPEEFINGVCCPCEEETDDTYSCVDGTCECAVTDPDTLEGYAAQDQEPEDPYYWDQEAGEWKVKNPPVQEELVVPNTIRENHEAAQEGRHNWWGEAEDPVVQGATEGSDREPCTGQPRR